MYGKFFENEKKERKEIKQKIKIELENGKSREDIYIELSKQYNDDILLRGLISIIPNLENCKRYRFINNILIFMVILTVLDKLLWGIMFFSNIHILAIPFAILIPTINVILLFLIIKRNYNGYIFLGILSFMSFMKPLANSTKVSIYEIGLSAFIFLIMILSFYIKSKLFPNYGLMIAKKDDNGNIKLG